MITFPPNLLANIITEYHNINTLILSQSINPNTPANPQWAPLITDQLQRRATVVAQQLLTPKTSATTTHVTAFNGLLVQHIGLHCEARLRVTRKY